MAAEETVRLIRIDTGDSVTTVAELKKYIKDLKEGIEDLEIGTEEYNDTLKALKQAQDAQRDSMHFGVETVKAAKGSYNDLVHTMRELKEQWRATNDETKRQEIGFQINEINNQLKQLDASVGVYGRNVGDYSNKFQEALVAVGGKAGAAAAGGIKQFKLGLDAVSKTPVIAVLGLLVNAIMAIVGALRSSEEGLNSVTPVMGVFSALSEGLTRILQGLGSVIATVANGLVTLADKLGLVNDKMREKQALAAREIELARSQRKMIEEEAKTERDVAILRDRVQQKEQYSDAERLAFLDQAIKKENDIAKKRVANAKEELSIYEAKNKNTKNSADVEKRLSELRAAVYNAERQQADTERRLLKERNALVSQNVAARKKEAEERRKAAREAQKDQLAAQNAAIAAEKDYYTLALSIAKAGSQEQLDLQNKIAALDYEKAVADAKAKIKDQETLQKTLTVLQDRFNLQRQKNQEAHDEKARAAEILNLENIRDGYKKGSAAYLAAQVDVLEEQYNTLVQKTGETDAEFLARRIAAFRALQDAREEYSNSEREREITRRENEMALLEEGSAAYLEKSVELKLYELETLHQLEEESDAEFRARQLIAEKAFDDERKKLFSARVTMMQTWAGNVSALATSVADAYEGMADDEEKATEQTKALRIAAAIIDTISGAIGAYMSAVSPTSGIPAPYNMILGAIQAATVTATGMANIAKLRAVNVKSGGGSVSAASVSAPPVVQQVPVTRSVTSATEEERLDRMAKDQRVVLVYSDVEEAGTYVDTVQTETEF